MDIQQFPGSELLEEITPQVAQVNTSKGCILLYDIEDPALQVRSSKIKLTQALVTLMANAIRSTPPGKRVTLSIRKTSENEVSFSVSDEGPGIKEEDKPAFLQNLGKGSGAGEETLGLVITRHVVELLGGSLQLASTPGHGTTLTIRIPLP